MLIMVAYPPWKSDFLRLNLQTKKGKLSALAINTFIQVSRWFAVHIISILFELFITDIIQRQNLWKIRLIYHLKHSLGLQWKRRFVNPPQHNWQTFCTSFESLPQFILVYKVFFIGDFYLIWFQSTQSWLKPQWPNDQKLSSTKETDQYMNKCILV